MNPVRFTQQVVRRAVFFALGLNNPKAWDTSLWNLYGNIDQNSGENITEQNSMELSAVWNAVRLIAETIAALPLHLMEKTPEGKRQAIENSLYTLLHSQANPYM